MTTLPQRVDQLEDALSDAGLDPAAHHEALQHVRRHLLHYAHLESELLGAVTVSVPRHLVGAEPVGDSNKALEILAHRERDRLALDEHESESLMERLDREGLKVYRAPFPEDSSLQGIFLFDTDVGPSLVVSDALDPAEDNFVFARLYGHYLMDNDPYLIRVAQRVGSPADANAERARAFASAFLIDRKELDSYLKAAGRSSEDPWTREMVEQLTTFLEVGPPALAARLRALGYLKEGEALPGEEAEPRAGRAGPSLPERYVRLALEAHAREMLDDEELAEYLETDVGTAEELARRFRLRMAGEDDGSGEESP